METMRERFVRVTGQLLDERPEVALVLAGISVDAFRPAMLRHPDRVINLGIREQLLISVAGGLALAGMRPVAHTIASFLVERPFEQIKLDLGHQGVGAVLVSWGASHDYAGEGRTHHAPGDVALLDTMPGWTVRVPGHADEAERMLRSAAAGAGLVYLRLSEHPNARPLEDTPGRITVLRRGTLGVVLAVGPLADRVVEATRGLDVTLLYAATVRPFDSVGLRAALDAGAASAVVLVEPYLAGTSSAVVAEALSGLPHRLLALGVGQPDLRRYGAFEQHEAAHGLDPESLRERISGFLDRSRAAASSVAARPPRPG